MSGQKKKSVPVAWQNKSITFICRISYFQICTRKDRKKPIYSNRKAIILFKALTWVMVLLSLDPWAFCCIFFRCFHREKIRRRKVVRDIVKGMNVNINLGGKRSLENCAEFFTLEM
jgi:hypothetical protein